MSDNGCQPTSTTFMQACTTLEIHQTFTSDNNPKGNTDTERFMRNLKEECLWRQEWTSPLALASALDNMDQRLQSIRCSPTYRPHFQFGLIVDSDLENLERYNNRELPVYGDFYLPQNMKFIYASSEIASETYTNMMIALADKESKRLRDYIIRERCDEGLRQAVNQPFMHFKQWDPSTFLPRTN
jgi:hypothetical protein